VSDFIATCVAGCEDQAIEEVKQAVGPVDSRRFFLKGMFFFSTVLEKKEVFSRIESADTVFLASVVFCMKKTDADIDSIVSAVKELLVFREDGVERSRALIGPGESFRVECNRRGTHSFSSVDVCRKTGSFVCGFCAAKVDIKNPSKAVRVEIIGRDAFVCIGLAKEVSLSKKVEGFVKSTVGKKPCFDARNKMKDVIEKWGKLICLDDSFCALDLGAAPGGWSAELSKVCGRVFAVDTAYLSQETSCLSNVVHVKKRMGDLVESDLGGVSKVQFVSCDASMVVDLLERIIFKIAKNFLEKGRFLVVTLKFPFRVKKETADHQISEFDLLARKSGFTLIEAVSLRHNTAFEKTALLKFEGN